MELGPVGPRLFRARWRLVALSDKLPDMAENGGPQDALSARNVQHLRDEEGDLWDAMDAADAEEDYPGKYAPDEGSAEHG